MTLDVTEHPPPLLCCVSCFIHLELNVLGTEISEAPCFVSANETRGTEKIQTGGKTCRTQMGPRCSVRIQICEMSARKLVSSGTLTEDTVMLVCAGKQKLSLLVQLTDASVHNK